MTSTFEVTFRPGQAQLWLLQGLLPNCIIWSPILTVIDNTKHPLCNEFCMKRACRVLSTQHMFMMLWGGVAGGEREETQHFKVLTWARGSWSLMGTCAFWLLGHTLFWNSTIGWEELPVKPMSLIHYYLNECQALQRQCIIGQRALVLELDTSGLESWLHLLLLT